MPAKSKEQQRLFGMVHAYQKGELKNPSKQVKDIADGISKKDALKFAKTKHKGLPETVADLDEGLVVEAFSSPKLSKMAKEHGGLDIFINGGMRDGVKAYYGGNMIDPSKITDEMLYGEPFEYDWRNTSDAVANNLIHFKDGYAVSLKPYDLKNSENINPERPRSKPSRYFTGIGDTGDHDKKPSPFFANGKKDVGPQYDGFGTSTLSGDLQHWREAIKNNMETIAYYKEHSDRNEAREEIRKAQENIRKIKGWAKETINKKKNESVDVSKKLNLSESRLRNVVRESVSRILKEAISDEEWAEFNHAAQKAYGALDGKKCGDYVYGQDVIFTMSDGTEMEGKISEYEVNPMTYKEVYDIDYIKDGKTWTMIGVPKEMVHAK